MDRGNPRVIWASQYISQFRDIEVRYKPGKDNIVSDALSRLGSSKRPELQNTPLHEVFAFAGTVVQITPETEQRILDGYSKHKFWKSVLNMLTKQTKRDEEAKIDPQKILNGSMFYLLNRLIYHRSQSHPRLCLPPTFENEIFSIAHGQAHLEYARTYQRVAETHYFYKMNWRLKNFLDHCLEYELLQQKHHKSYSELVSLRTPDEPYHTIAMDFIGALSKQDHGFDMLLTVTCKFSKKLLLIHGKSTWKASEWAESFLDALNFADWGIPCAYISDRDSKFLDEFWRALFKRLGGTKFLTSTTYHPQTDGQSERTNQTVEVALRYWTCEYDSSWVKALSSLQTILNNSLNVSTDRAPNEIITDVRAREPLNLITGMKIPKPPEERELDREVFRQEAADAISFANAKFKIYYDHRYKPLMMAPEEMAYLKLHHGYRLPENFSRKLSKQRIGPFKILERVGRLAYKLELPVHWKIHPVVSIAQLEPAKKRQDLYNRSWSDHPPAVETEGDTEKWKSYEVEKLIGKRMRRYGRKIIAEYLVR